MLGCLCDRLSTIFYPRWFWVIGVCLYLIGMLPTHAETIDNQEGHKKPNPMPTAILYDDKFLWHDTGPEHPENPQRLRAVINKLKTTPELSRRIFWPAFTPATHHDLQRIHTKDYIALVKREVDALMPNETRTLSTGDTVISPKTFEVASLAAGAGIAGVDLVLKGVTRNAIVLARPPGHHASASRGMGFCVFNNVAIAARYAQQQYGIQRILIADIDVHHGNGTQDIFYNDPSVFYFSVHQHPLYPGTGRPHETGTELGKGFTLNVDLPAGSGDKAILSVLEHQLMPAMAEFEPELILVSAGFDAHIGDPLGGLGYTDAGYLAITSKLQKLATLYSQERLIFILEGGYSPNNIQSAVESILQGLPMRD